jgi:hypothetical protein
MAAVNKCWTASSEIREPKSVATAVLDAESKSAAQLSIQPNSSFRSDRSDDDIDIAITDLEVGSAQPVAATPRMLPGYQVKFIPVPRARNVVLVRERELCRGTILSNGLDDALVHTPLTDRPTHMGAIIKPGN